jgi:hypothetical protein
MAASSYNDLNSAKNIKVRTNSYRGFVIEIELTL